MNAHLYIYKNSIESQAIHIVALRFKSVEKKKGPNFYFHKCSASNARQRVAKIPTNTWSNLKRFVKTKKEER